MIIRKKNHILQSSQSTLKKNEKESCMNRIKKLRKLNGITQSKLGFLLGVNNTAISKYESGHVKLTDDLLEKLSDIFDVSIDYILHRTDILQSHTDVSTFNTEDQCKLMGDRIKQLRLSANMTQEEFGQKFGIVKSTISLYESGKSTPNDQIKKNICEYFNVSMDYLFGYEPCDIHISPKDQQVFDIFHKDPERVMELLSSFSKLSTRNKTIILGKCFELEYEDKGKNNTEQQYKEEGIKKAT